ncbi:hypothetical protein PWT90_01954 [Aphanocladium album]|nr:hypothetical protein PWT90_01954 [Aphanocladium album]
MDTRDVSQDREIATALENAIIMHERAQIRNGQLVNDHPPPAALTAGSLAMRMNLKRSSMSDKIHIFTTQLPPPYAPCDRSIDELQSMFIIQMRLGVHHRGAKVMVRVLTPPNRMNAILVIVEDLEGTAVTLQLYHHPPEAVACAEDTIQVGSVLILKEPFFKCATDGSYSLRVDHLSDVVWLGLFDHRIPDLWRKSDPETSSEAARLRGNEAVKTKRWAQALRLYSDAGRYAVTPEEAQLAFVNRSFANLNLGRFEQALLDATRTNERIPSTEKAKFREIRALYELGRFGLCKELLEHFTTEYPDNRDAKLQMSRAEARFQESNEGMFSFAESMYKQARQSSAVIDCATFSKPVEVREAPGRGRGLFTVQTVRAGDLLLCEKAFVYKQRDTHSGGFSILMDVNDKRAFAGGQAEILNQAIQNLYHNPEMSRPFLELHHGDYKPVSRQRADGNPIVDSFLVAKVMALNVFGAPRTSRDTLRKTMERSKDAADESGGFGTVGIWIKASYVNHSCVGNCRRSFIGDMLVLRATTDMEAGTELLFPYRSPRELESYSDVQRGLKNWGFVCDCILCRARLATPAQQLGRRKALMEDLRGIIDKRGATALARGVRLLDDLKGTYHASYSVEAPRLELHSFCFAMATEYYQRGDLSKTVDMLLRGLRALGFEITALWPPPNSAVTGLPAPQFEIKRWGIARDMVPWAFVNLHGASRSMAPSLSERILEYAQTAYSMVVGERETFFQTFPTAR